ncbi:unnamed protein product, partial [Globisporangium polare]
MADGWISVMQRHFDAPAETAAFLARTTSAPDVDDSAVMAVITTDDVAAAIKKCKRGKAAGPDELGNTFYRDFATELAPILAPLFTWWLECGAVPASFGEANTQCLKKSAAAARPLDHRPIALLNSDYKIFTKILETRIRPLLPRLVDNAQVGFVPGRTIEMALDIFATAKIAAASDEKQRQASVLLLDFAKAYDSLQRPFLFAALKWLGFSQKFVTIVGAMHETTTCRFLVNGYLSRQVEVTCGIRQGCPLAPLLFILALDTLYKVIRARPDIDGIQLQAAGRSEAITVSGYADDTAVYLR